MTACTPVASLPLSAEDRAILDLEGPNIAGHTCKVIVCAGPAAGRAAISARVAQGLAGAPLLRSRLGTEGDSPAWVDDPGFELAEHVVERPGPALEPSLLPVAVAATFEQRLPRDRPLWRLEIMPLAGGGFALVWLIHHALADGTTAMRYGREILWDPVATEEGGAKARGEAGNGGQAHLDAREERRRRAHLAGLVRRELPTRPGIVAPFSGQITARRGVAFATIPFQPFHDVARRLADATVNDALLAIVAGAVRRWIELHDGALGRLRLRVPVSLHNEDDESGNLDSFFTLPVDLEQADPLLRLSAIHAAAGERKADHDAELIDAARHRIEERSQALGELAERLFGGARSFGLCVSNVRGPVGRLQVCGAPVESIHTLAEIGRNHALRVAAISACGDLNLGFCADEVMVPDVETIAAAAELEAAALIDMA